MSVSPGAAAAGTGGRRAPVAPGGARAGGAQPRRPRLRAPPRMLARARRARCQAAAAVVCTPPCGAPLPLVLLPANNSVS